MNNNHILHAYHEYLRPDNQDEDAWELKPIPFSGNLDPNTPLGPMDSIMARYNGELEANKVAQFIQLYSRLCSIKKKFDLPMPKPITESLPFEHHQTELKHFEEFLDKAQIPEAELALCRTAQALCEHYLTLHGDIKNALSLFTGDQLMLVKFLAGEPEIREEEKPLNALEQRLIEKGLNSDEAPDHYCCPISGELMIEPVNVSGNNVTHVYDKSIIDQIIQIKKDEAVCPNSQRLLSTLTITPNLALKQEIADWVEKRVKAHTCVL